MLAIFSFHADDEIDFDVDLRELQGQDRLDVLCGFLREIGRRLGKQVLMDPEGEYGHPVLGFDVEEVGASDQELQQIAADALREVYFQDSGRRAGQLEEVRFTDIEHVEFDL